MNPEIQSLLIKAAEKLGTTVEALWGVLIKQQYVFGAQVVVVALALMAIIYILARIYPGLPIHNPDRYEIHPRTAAKIGIIVASGLLIVSINTVLSRFINPEFHAMMDLKILLGL